MFNYTPHYKPKQLICGYAQTAVITGWTIKQYLAQHLSAQEFAVIGNLYSCTRGISPLIRNLLANPHVRFLVILNATKEDKNAGACDCLLDFFRYGFIKGKSDTGRECWVIHSKTTGYIDIEISADALENLRQALQWQEAKSIPEAVSMVKAYAQQDLL
ncbi:MAG: thymidylate synthase, partial [Microcystaceae cyanobacterium]